MTETVQDSQRKSRTKNEWKQFIQTVKSDKLKKIYVNIGLMFTAEQNSRPEVSGNVTSCFLLSGSSLDQNASFISFVQLSIASPG